MGSDEGTKSQAATDGSRATRQSVRPGGPGSLIGVTLSGRYRIERFVGEGGMASVYLAEHVHMRKKLAVKVLHPEMSRLPEVVARFEREAMAASHIEHPNVATATDFGKLEDGSFFLVLEYVEGRSLRDAINEGRLELGRSLHVLRQIASALGRAHALKIVHRDLKPENVMLVERDGDADFVKVLDFGIAKVPMGEMAQTNAEPGKVLTQLGMVYGTPEYMAPEQALGQNVDARADLYAVGCMAFEMLTGSRPYDHESKVALLGMHVTAAIPLASQRAPDAMIPAEVDQLLVKCLAKEATERFQDARELIDATNFVIAQLVSVGRIDAKYLGLTAPQPSQLGMQPLSGPMSISNPRASLAGVGTSSTSLAGAPISAYRGASGIPTGEVPPTSRSARALAPKTLAALGAGAVGVLALVGVVTVVMARGGRAQTLPDGAISAMTDEAGVAVVSGSGGSSGVAAPPARPEIDAQVKDAIGLVDKGDYASAIEQLSALALANPTRADIHRALVDAYMATKRFADAMDEADTVLGIDPNVAKDKNFRASIRNAALAGTKDADDKAFALMADKMGPDGPDALYDIAYITTGYPKASSRAKLALKKSDVRAKATDELKLALDLRDAAGKSPCEIHKYLDRAAEVGDWRASHVLKGYLSQGGCGFLGRRDCWPCLHGDGALARAIRSIDERAKKQD